MFRASKPYVAGGVTPPLQKISIYLYGCGWRMNFAFSVGEGLAPPVLWNPNRTEHLIRYPCGYHLPLKGKARDLAVMYASSVGVGALDNPFCESKPYVADVWTFEFIEVLHAPTGIA